MLLKFIEDSKLHSSVTFTNDYLQQEVQGLYSYCIAPLRQLTQKEFHPFRLGIDKHSPLADFLFFLYKIATFKEIVSNVIEGKAMEQEKMIFIQLIVSKDIAYRKYDRENKCYDVSLNELRQYFRYHPSRKCKHIVMYSEIIDNIINPT